MTEVDLNLNIKEFEETKKQAQKDGNIRFSGEEQNKFYSYEDMELEYIEEELEGNIMKISGTMMKDKKEIGQLYVKVPLDLEKLIDIFQLYVKKLQKVKNVMESVKDE